MSLTLDDFRQYPKVELHRHIDGSVPKTVIRRIALRDGVSEFRLRPTEQHPEGRAISLEDYETFDAFYQIHTVDSFNDLLSRFDFVLRLMQTPEGIEEIFYECVLDATRKNIWYVEWTMAPAYHTREGLSYEEVVRSALRGIERGKRETGAMGKLILGINREACTRAKPEDKRDPNGTKLARVAMKFQNKGVCGLGLVCNEAQYPPELYRDAFHLIENSTLASLPHAGEFGNRKENIETALTTLNADRLGHGISLGSNLKLLQQIADNKVGVELNPLSNIHTGAIEHITDLRIDTLLKHGVLASINSDDPALFEKELADNFYEVFATYDWGEKELAQFTMNALLSAAMTDDERKERIKFHKEKLRKLG